MINLKKGSKIPFPEKIFEQFEVSKNRITANVGVEKAEDIIRDFIENHNEPLFFILETPTSKHDEPKNADGEIETCHKDIYYLDGCSQEEAIDILNKYAELLINDGMSTFGFGGHYSEDEILFGKYNVMTIFSKEINKFINFLKKYDLEQVENLVTAWDTFTKENPGLSNIITVDDKTVYSIPKELKDKGMYFAKRERILR